MAWTDFTFRRVLERLLSTTDKDTVWPRVRGYSKAGPGGRLSSFRGMSVPVSLSCNIVRGRACFVKTDCSGIGVEFVLRPYHDLVSRGTGAYFWPLCLPVFKRMYLCDGVTRLQNDYRVVRNITRARCRAKPAGACVPE